MKRFLAILLCAALLLPMAMIPAQAVVIDTPDTGKVVTVIAGSDFQYSNSDHGIAGGHMESILEAIKADGHTADGFLFAGDYSQAFTVDASKAGSDYFKGVVSKHFPELEEDRKVFVQGNHDPDPLTTDGTLAASGAHDTEDYGVFVINEKDYMWYSEMDEATIKTTAARLRSYMNAKCKAGYTKPIFVVSHLQLHYSMRTNIHGDGMYANYLFDVLNEAGANGLNIFFLFGHNHSNGWDDYLGGAAVFLTRGDSILIAQGSQTEFKEETLNFTYLNAGYVGYYTKVNTGAESDLTMTTFQITEDTVTVSRYSADGLHDLKSVGVTNAYKEETAYEPDTRVYTSSQRVTLNQQIRQPEVSGVRVDAEGVTAAQGVLGASQVPAGYSAYQTYDISATGYTAGDTATITVPVGAEFDENRPTVVIDHQRDRVLPVQIESGTVSFTANHLGLFTVAQTAGKAISATGTVANYLRFVSGNMELKPQIPYVIMDSKITEASQWMLTTQSGSYTSSSGGQYQGLLLEEIASPTTEYVWYYDNGNLRALTPDGDYLLISYTGEYNGNSTQSLVSVGAYDSATAARVILYSVASSDYQIRYPDTANPLYLHRRGGGSNNVAVTYTTENASNSLWHFYEVVSSATLSVLPARTTVSTGSTVSMLPTVTAGTQTVTTYTLSWSSDDTSIATVSSDGVVTAKKAGQVYINATLTAVEGSTLSAPAKVRILLTVVKDTADTKVTATTVLGQQLGKSNAFDPDNLTAGGPYAIVEYFSNWFLTGNEMLKTTEGYNGASNYEGLEMIDCLPLYNGPAWYLDENGLYLNGSKDQYLVFDGTRATLGAPSDTNHIMTLHNTAYGASNSWNIYYIGATDGTAANLVYRSGPPYNVASKTGNHSSYWVLYDLIPARTVALSVSPSSKIFLPEQTVTLDATVTVDGAAAADYVIEWTSSDQSVATVDADGNLTALAAGNAVITATLPDAGISVEISIQVASVTEDENGTHVTMVLESEMERVTQLKEGQAYVITSCLNNNWVMTNGIKTAKKDPAYSGLILEDINTAGTHLWYYEEEAVDGVTKQYLRYGSVTGAYIACNDQVAVFGDKADNVLDAVTLDTKYSAFTIGQSSSGRLLHQHGGASYDVAVPANLWTDAQGSRWYFNALTPQRTLSVTVDTAAIQLHLGSTQPIRHRITVDGVEISDYELVWQSSDGETVSVEHGVVSALKAGSATVTATVTSVQGRKLDTPIVLEVPVTVEGHTWDAGSCTAPQTCIICGTTQGTPTPHSYTEVVTAPTCTEGGYTTYTCLLCGHSYVGSEVEAQGHSYAAEVTAPTCTEGGYTTYTCLICGDSYVADEMDALGHSYESAVTAPTCTEGGYTTYTCLICGDSYVADEVDALGHSFDKGSCTLCGEKDPEYVTAPTLTLEYPTLSFEDEILYNVYYSIDDPSNVVEMGLITFAERLTDGTMDDALDVVSGYVSSGATYMVQSNGIPAKNLSDAVYFKVYAKLSDGSYVYSEVAGYHAVAYANTVLGSDAAPKAKALVVAMLNYGAAAQEYFGYKTDALMNASLTAEQQALVQAYDSSMVQDVVKADANKVGIFIMNGGYSNAYPTVSFEGAFSINFYFTPNKPVDAAPVMYYWDSVTYNSVDELTPENATGVITMAQDGSNWGAAVEGIAAKAIDETVYVAGFYTCDGVSYPTGVIAYSLGNYCKTIAANGETFGAATAVYGFYAKAYFAK